MNFDHVFIDEMEIACQIGTTEEERAYPQIVKATLRIFFPLTNAAQTDDLSNTIDYAKIIADVRVRTKSRSYVLVETLAEEIAAIALQPSVAQAAEVTIQKKVFEGIKAVGAHIRREKNPL